MVAFVTVVAHNVKVLWVMLAYRLPREPSTPRIALWRNLRRLGAVQVLDGLAALPLDARTRERMEWLAEDVRDAGGTAGVWLGEPVSRGDQRELEASVREAVTADYRKVIEAARVGNRGAVGRLRRTLENIDARDWLGVPERKRAHATVDALTAPKEARR
jgi:hypothetical protein